MVCLDVLVWVMTVYVGFCIYVLVWFPYSKVVFLEILIIWGLLWYFEAVFPFESCGGINCFS